jgi:hypothetical protein
VRPVREGSQLSRIHLGFVNEVDMHSNQTLRFVSQETLLSLAHFNLVWAYLLKLRLD